MPKKVNIAGVFHKKLAMVSNLLSVCSQKYRPPAPATINQRLNPAVIPATLDFPPSESEVLINKVACTYDVCKGRGRGSGVPQKQMQ